jgi:Holliday junction resolvase RusA-like endonuclease
MTKERWYILEINPEQWKIGPLSVGRANGGQFARIGPDHQLQAYQNAVKELLEDDCELVTGKVKLTLVFWRQMEEYKTARSRTSRRHQADLTNLQKALEDAIQGVLIENDREVQEVHSYIAAQGHFTRPLVVIKVEEWREFNPEILPSEVWSGIYDKQKRYMLTEDDKEDSF